MKSINLQNFKYGLDTRRSELTSQLGTLLTCQDAHINNGAEIEKRKAFGDVLNADLRSLSTIVGVPHPNYGLEVNSAGLVVFSSFSLNNTLSITTISGAVVTITARNLTEPYNSGLLTSIPASCNFNGVDVAAATFSGQPYTLLFVGGVVVQKTNTTVYTLQAGDVVSDNTMATAIAAELNTFFTGPPLLPFTASASTNVVTITPNAYAANNPGMLVALLPLIGTGLDGTHITTNDAHGIITAAAAGSPVGAITLTFTHSGGNWTAGSTVTSKLVSIPNLQNVNSLITFKNKVYAGNGTYVEFSDVADPTTWQPTTTNNAGSIQLLSQYGIQDICEGFAPYQGLLAVFMRQTVQVWNMASVPANSILQQILGNIGTPAPLSIQPLGDWDVIFLYDSGIRSLRVRDASNNAFVLDLGAPVDTLVQAALTGATPAQVAAACSVVSPTESRYWLFIPDGVNTIYVLSYWPQAKITAWSTYTPTLFDLGDNSAQSFVAQKFVQYKGLLFCRGTYSKDGTDRLFGYGPSLTASLFASQYDKTQAIIETSWLDGKEPTVVKNSQGIDLALSGRWVVSAAMNSPDGNAAYETVWTGGSTTTPLTYADSPFEQGTLPYVAKGTHFKMKAVSGAFATAAKLSALIFKFTESSE